jgi:rRNA maturation RNase YbeY
MARLPTPKIKFHLQNVSFSFRNRRMLKAFIMSVFKKERKDLGSLNYVFCSDRKLLEINRTYLGHDYYTDVVTFDLSSRPGPIDAEIYISVERVKENARLFNVSYQEELIRVILHGALHLCGYRDKSKSDHRSMTKKEDLYLDRYRAFHVKHRRAG